MNKRRRFKAKRRRADAKAEWDYRIHRWTLLRELWRDDVIAL